MEARLLFGRQQIEEERRGDEDAHAFGVEADAQWMELDLRQPGEGGVEVPLQIRVVEEAELLDLLVDAIRIQMRVAELGGAAETKVVHPRHWNRDGGNGDGVGDELWQSGAPARGIPQAAGVHWAVRRERLEDEEDRGEGERSAGDGAASDGEAGSDGKFRLQRGVQVEQGQRDAQRLGGEPHLAADAAAPGDGAEAEDQREGRMLPLWPRLLHAPQEPVEERDVERGQHHREPDVVEVEAPDGDEGHHHHCGEGGKRHVPAPVLQHPVVQVGRPLAQGELAVEEGIRLVDEVRRQRLVREQPVAGDGVDGERGGEEDEVDAVARGEIAPARRPRDPVRR